MIQVFQIQLTNEEVDAANRRESTPKIEAYFSRGVRSNFNPEDMQYYTHVANVDADDLEDAFRLMNLWEDESKIERVFDQVSSMSVGDILEHDGKYYICATCGFKNIESL